MSTPFPANSRYEIRDDGTVYDTKLGRALKPCDDGHGYLVVALEVAPHTYKLYRVHRLVAEAFVPGYRTGLVVNHLNEIKHDNRADNLAWVTRSQNSTWHGAHLRSAAKRSHAVVGYADDNSFFAVYPSHHAAARATGICREGITRCVLGKGKSAGGFRWRAI